MLKFDRAKFFEGFRREFGTLTAARVVSIESFLAGIESDPHIKDIRWASYQCATVIHETAGTFDPLDEYGGAKYFESRYGAHTQVGRRLGNTEPGDGNRFHGRGYCQITGRRNYRVLSTKLFEEYGQVVDLELSPEKAKEILTAYRILSVGMRLGIFTSKKLSDYISGSRCDYKNARRIINGMDRASLIASHAVKFERILRASVATQPLPDVSAGLGDAPVDATLPATASAGTIATLAGGGAVAVAGTAAVASSGASDGISWVVIIIIGLLVTGAMSVAVLWWLGRESK